ncbi:golgi-body localization protein domain-containing protein [Bombardia bombarda]|uniref:COP9 signalosome complex subunit 5 n=1 Tax=Bombardia bombarda TaxID=252184 RepID=A0AA39XBB0_9PEZI|nr:golgi-body localization protein domain-containing protein [Bombardia bombarda]
MALLNPTFIFGILVLLYLSSFVIFAVLRIITGISIQRIGYFSLRRLAYTPRDGLKIEIRGLGLNVHRPTFAQPTWLSIVVNELVVTVDIAELDGSKRNGATSEDDPLGPDKDGESELLAQPPKAPPIRRNTSLDGRSKTWKQLTKLKERVKRLHRNVNSLRMVDIVATNSTVSIVNVGNVQLGSVTVAVDTRRKMVDRARFFLQGRSNRTGENQQAEWIMTLRSVLFTADGRESLEVLDNASLNIHGFLYKALDGLRDAAVALKLGRVHIPYDDVRHSIAQYKIIKAGTRASQLFAEPEPIDVFVDKVIQEIDVPGSTNNELMQTVSDSKELVSSVLRGIKEVQFAVSFIGFTKKIEAVKAGGSPILLNASMKEVGIDLHRLDPKSPAHRMYFPSKDIAHEALAAALSISVGLDDGHGKPERLMYIPMATTTKTADPDEFDLIISSISSISLDMESFHSAVEDLHYSLAANMRVQTHKLYYQTSSGSRFNLLETESFELKVQLNATPDVHVVATGNLQTFTLKLVREEIGDGLRHIVRQLRLEVQPDKMAVSKGAKKSNFLRAMPAWLLRFQLQCDDFSFEVAGLDEVVSKDARGVAIQLDSWSADYSAQRLETLQRRPSRRRASTRGMTPDAELLKAAPMSPKRRNHHDGDDRRMTIQVRGLECFIIESADKMEIEPFVSIPKFDLVFTTLSDNQGPVFRVSSQIKTILVQYSLYRHYAVGVAIMVLRKAFMRTSRDIPEPVTPPTSPVRRVVGHLSPISSLNSPDFPLFDSEFSRSMPELVSIDIKATLVQVKVDTPSDPSLMIQIYNVEAGRHRWSPPFFQFKLIRLYAEAPRMRRVWARIISINNGRVDYRESRRKLPSGALQEERMFDIVSDTIRVAVPHEMVVHKITDNVINIVKSSQQLHHRFKTGTNEYILDKGPEGPKNVPKVSVKTRSLLFELEDGAFEWKLGVIYRAGRIEQLQRQAREEAFRVKIKKIHDEESRRESSKLRTRSAAPRGRQHASHIFHHRSHSTDDLGRSSDEGHVRRRLPRYDPEGSGLGISGNAQISVAEARHNLNVYNAKSWKQRIDRRYAMAKKAMKNMHVLSWGRDEIPDDLADNENILEVPHRPALMAAIINDLHFTIDKPSFPMKDLPDFLHKVGKGMPKDMKYSLLVPMSVQINMGEARISLRDYPLPFVHVPPLKSGQSSRLPALSMRTDFVIAEEFRGSESSRKVRVEIVPPRSLDLDPASPKAGCFAIDVRRTIGPVKSFSDMTIDINTTNPTRITWGPSYQPAIQDMMMAIESMTKPQIDPSDRVGFWDKIRLNFHSRVRVAWRGDGDVHLALKGARDPYQVTGNGAGFIMCWRNDVKWNIHTDDDPKQFMSVESAEYVIAVPDYGHHVRDAHRREGEDDSIETETSHKSGAAFKKVVMKLSGKVQVLAGLVFERAIEKGNRDFSFKPHYEVELKSPHSVKIQDPNGLPYDAFRGFRSQHIHLSVAVRAPVDREWSASNVDPSRSYNTVHLTPRFFTHFFSWWSLFGGPLSLPVRQGTLWPGREKNSKKFGRHLATLKYSLLLAPLFLSHIYKHKDSEEHAENAFSATGIKVRFDSFMLDLHQRREEFNTRDRGRKTQTRTSGMKIHAGQLDLVSADIRAVSASIRGPAGDSLPRSKQSFSTFVTGPDEDSADLSRFTIPDNDLTWIDMDDFVELDWILPTEPNPDTKILPLAYAPRITYFRQTDIGGVIEGDPDRTSPFGKEPTHLCIMSQDDDPRRVQGHLIRRRLEQLDQQMATHTRNLGEIELRIIRNDISDKDLRADFDALTRHTGVLVDKKTFLEGMLREMRQDLPLDTEDDEYSNASSVYESQPTTNNEGSTKPSSGTEFASDFKNRFVVHNMQLKWNNTLRNIILRYIHQVSQRRGFVYYLSRPAVKFILDIVEEQVKSKTAKGGSTASPDSPDTNGTDRDTQKDIEDRIRKILQEGKKFTGADDSGPTNTSMADLTSGIADEFIPQNSYHVRVIAPQIQLQSDKNKKHVVLITAKGMELKVVEVLDKSRISDTVSGLVQRRFLVNMDSTQFFVTHQKWFSTQLVSMYSGSTYGTPANSSWPPWVPMEVMFDFQTDPFGFKRVVQKTSAMLRYDKYNTLRLKYNDDVNTSEGTSTTAQGETETRMDNLWVEFPQAHALCNSSQYYAIYVIVLDLLMYNEPLEKTRSERLEKIMLASDFSDLRGAPEMVIRLQERVRQLEEIKTHFQIHYKNLDKKGWKDRMVLERDLAACEDELFFMMKAITTSQRKFDTTASSALLKWSITAKEIVWHLIRDNNEPLVELQLKDVEYDRTDNSDGSHINLIQVHRILGLNLLPDAIYPAMVAPYVVEGDRGGFDTGLQPMIRVYWYMLEAIAGIPVMDHFEVNLFPLKIQLERELGMKLFEYIFPGIDGDKPSSGKNDSPFMLKQTFPGDDDDDDAETDSLAESIGRLATGDMDKDGVSFSTRPGSLELRLRPTLTSDPGPTLTKQKALSIHSGDGNSFRLFRSGTGFRAASKKPSYESLRGSATPRPGIGRSATGFSSKDTVSLSGDSRKESRFRLRNKSTTEEERAKKSDDLTKMIDRASNYMTFAHIKMPSVVLCLSYKGKGDRNLEDVHDFVFRLPTIEYHNKTWSNLDLALALKSRVIKALIGHTGAIIGNKFSRHRPNTAQQSKLRELATSSVLLATPQLSDSRDNSGDDSSSLYGTSPVDFSRSPPRSIRQSQTSIPVPSSRSSSIASSRSHQSSNMMANSQGGGSAAVPGGFTMTPPTPTVSNEMQSHGQSSSSSHHHHQKGFLRPGTSAGVTTTVISSGYSHHGEDGGPQWRKSTASGGGGFLRDKLSALTQRLKERDASSLSPVSVAFSAVVGVEEDEESDGGDDKEGDEAEGGQGGPGSGVGGGGSPGTGTGIGGIGLKRGWSHRLPANDTNKLVDSQRDALYSYDAESQKDINSKKPWISGGPNYFKTVRISAVALMKMVMHARSGGSLEVMGLMQGYVDQQSLIVTDAFRLPVEGTETRVNAQDDANEYLVEYLRRCREDDSRLENAVGWYHSHPGYGCWLSGIDVSTQVLQQTFNDPFVAVVIDPDRTVSANKVEIGAFRTYPDNHTPAAGGAAAAAGNSTSEVSIGPDGFQTVPLNKAEDFGAHSSRYYSLEVEHFKSALDSKLLELLWNKYWVQTLAQNPLLTNRDYATSQMLDLGSKVHKAAVAVQRVSKGGPAGGGGGVPGFVSSASSKAVDQNIEKLVRDAKQVAAKERAGLMAAEVKESIFKTPSTTTTT